MTGTQFGSSAFCGEPVSGTWQLTFCDYCSVGTPTTLSATSGQMLAFMGH